MKRLTSVLLVLIMCVSALSACSGAPVKQTESVTESVTETARPKAKLSELKKKIDLAYFKGITLITKDGETVLNYSTGKTAATNGKKVDENTAFCIASVTKQFTAAAIMLLKEKDCSRLTIQLTSTSRTTSSARRTQSTTCSLCARESPTTSTRRRRSKQSTASKSITATARTAPESKSGFLTKSSSSSPASITSIQTQITSCSPRLSSRSAV